MEHIDLSKFEVKPGDWILPMGSNFMARLIMDLTFGKVNHAAIVVDSRTILETDGAWFKSKHTPLSKYHNRALYLVRPLFYPSNSLLEPLFKKYKGKVYGYGKIGLQAIFSPLHPVLKAKLVEFFGLKNLMICSSLVARITYEATGYKSLRDWEGMTPEDLRSVALLNPHEFEIYYQFPPQ